MTTLTEISGNTKGRLLFDENTLESYVEAPWGVYHKISYDSGGYAGGSGAHWNAPAGSAPLSAEENGETVFKFSAGGTEKLVKFLRVTKEHVAGDQISMKIAQYSPSATDTQLIVAKTYLIRKDVDAVSDTTNSHDSTNTALTNTVAYQYRVADVDLTDTAGKINSVEVSPGDLLRIEISRGTDTDTDEVRFIPSATETYV